MKRLINEKMRTGVNATMIDKRFYRRPAYLLKAYINNVIQWSVDGLFSGTSLLLRGNGTQNLKNNTFVDESDFAHPISVSGSPTQLTKTPFTDYTSTYFSGVTDVLSFPASADFVINGDFTLECWFKLERYKNGQNRIFGMNTNDPTCIVYAATFGQPASAAKKLQFVMRNKYSLISSSYIELQTWYHVAVTYETGVGHRLFINGVLEAMSSYTSALFGNSSNPFFVGRDSAGDSYAADCSLFNFRLVKDQCLYKTNFTPSKNKLSAIPGTILLTCQDAFLVDNSPYKRVATVVGAPKIMYSNPLVSETSETTKNSSGSSFFKVSNGIDAISIPAHESLVLDGDFTIELSGYIASTTSRMALFHGNFNGDLSYAAYVEFGTTYGITFGIIPPNGTAAEAKITLMTTPAVNVWYHIAVVRKNGVINGYLNGIKKGTITSSRILDSDYGIRIASADGAGGDYTPAYGFDGVLSNIHIMKGYAKYDGSFNLSTIASQKNQYTSLLLNFKNSNVIDFTRNQTYEIVGGVSTENIDSKYGNAIKFDGTGKIVFESSFNLTFRSANFTIEGWMKIESDQSGKGIFQISDAVGGLKNTFNTGVALYIATDGNLAGYCGATSFNTGVVVPQNEWVYFTLVRNAGTLKCFVNGNLLSTVSAGTELIGSYLCVGGYNSDTTLINGLIEDFRITSGSARYSDNFIPPLNSLS